KSRFRFDIKRRDKCAIYRAKARLRRAKTRFCCDNRPFRCDRRAGPPGALFAQMQTETYVPDIWWGTFNDLKRVFSIPRSTAYLLIERKLIRSRLIPSKGQRGIGRRLIDLRSVEEFLDGCPTRPTPAVRRKMKRRAEKSADARLLAKAEREQATAARNGSNW